MRAGSKRLLPPLYTKTFSLLYKSTPLYFPCMESVPCYDPASSKNEVIGNHQYHDYYSIINVQPCPLSFYLFTYLSHLAAQPSSSTSSIQQRSRRTTPQRNRRPQQCIYNVSTNNVSTNNISNIVLNYNILYYPGFSEYYKIYSIKVKQLHIIQLWLLIVFLEPSKGSKSLFFAGQLLEPLDGSKMQ